MDRLPINIYQLVQFFLAINSNRNVCIARCPAGTLNEKIKNGAGPRILGIGEVDRLSCLGVGSLTELPLNLKTLDPLLNPKTLALIPKPWNQTYNPKTIGPKPCVGDTRVLWVIVPVRMEAFGHSKSPKISIPQNAFSTEDAWGQDFCFYTWNKPLVSVGGEFLKNPHGSSVLPKVGAKCIDLGHRVRPRGNLAVADSCLSRCAAGSLWCWSPNLNDLKLEQESR